MRSFPWESLAVGFGDDGFPIYDRSYNDQDWADVYQTFFSYGVFMSNSSALNIADGKLQVTAGDGMTVKVATGVCHIRGRIGVEVNQRTLALTEAYTTDRIDTIVLRWSKELDKRNLDLYVLTGVASESPVRPGLTRSETVYELGIADIFVPRNTTATSNERITDTRLDNARCGVVTPFDTIDTTTFYSQIQAALDKQIGELQTQTDQAVKLAQDTLSQVIITNEKIDELWNSSTE